jgi:hypothetical protein
MARGIADDAGFVAFGFDGGPFALALNGRLQQQFAGLLEWHA